MEAAKTAFVVMGLAASGAGVILLWLTVFECIISVYRRHRRERP